ncbi:MAG: outer membrane beta-barrel protein [Parvularculaceae bacterium]|nr:outer membrane beta-barrel protein [Parvularculaceae bacterium]
MAKSSSALLVTASVAIAAFATAKAGSYIQVHAGLTQPAEETVEFGGTGFIDNVVGQEVDSDEDFGFTGGALIGAYVVPFIALEGEFTARTEALEDVNGETVGDAFSENLTTYAFMVNGVVRPSIPVLPDPYVGVGFGYLQPNFEGEDDLTQDGQMAYQLKAGLSFGLLPGMGKLGVEASYLATDDFAQEEDVVAEVAAETYSFGGLTGLVTYRLGF